MKPAAWAPRGHYFLKGWATLIPPHGQLSSLPNHHLLTNQKTARGRRWELGARELLLQRVTDRKLGWPEEQ